MSKNLKLNSLNKIYLSFSDSTLNVLSMIVVHWRPRIRKVNGFGRSYAHGKYIYNTKQLQMIELQINCFSKYCTAFMIWHPFTVKLFKGSARAMFVSGLFLKPRSEPSSRSMKYLRLQFFMCSPENVEKAIKLCLNGNHW